jgi:hypothetical protein
MYHLDVLLLIQVNISSKLSPLFETAAHHAPAWYIRDFSEFSVCCSSKNCHLLNVLQLLLMFVGMLTYLEPELFLLIMFYNGTFLIGNVLIVFI